MLEQRSPQVCCKYLFFMHSSCSTQNILEHTSPKVLMLFIFISRPVNIHVHVHAHAHAHATAISGMLLQDLIVWSSKGIYSD